MIRVAAAFVLILALAAPILAAEPSPVQVTGRTLDVNGQTEIPVGMFGVHAFKVTEERARDWGIEMKRVIRGVGGKPTPRSPEGIRMVIDCLGDRYQPALVLTRKDWREACEQAGRDFAEGAKALGYTCYAEFWNEPFLNWATKPGVNYDPKFYDESEAELGKPMRIKGWDEPLEFLVWDQAVRSVHAGGGTDLNAYLAWDREGRKHPEGAEFEWRGRTYRNVKTWWGRDVTQTSWYSARQNGRFYDWMFVPFARAAKTANPDVVVIGGWNFNISLDGWALWRNNIRPTIDASIEWLDGIDEHHYYVGATQIPAWYETVVAYTATEHGKRIRCYNTECGGFADTMLPGNEALADAPKEDPVRKAVQEFTYHLRDTLGCLATVPDKAASRAKHGEPSGDLAMSADEAFFRLLKPLRGRLVEVVSPDPDVWPVASLGRQGNELVLVVFNDHADARNLALKLAAPEGTKFSGGTRTWVEVDAAARTLRMKDVPVKAAGAEAALAVDVPGKTAVRVVLPLEGTPPAKATVARRQFFAKGVLHEVKPTAATKLEVEVDPALLARAEWAVLRLVLEGVGDREGAVRVGEAEIALPDRGGVVDVPVDLRAVSAKTPLAFTSKGDGYQVDAASVVLTVPAR